MLFKNISLYTLGAFLLGLITLSSCSHYIAPQFTSVGKVASLQVGMTTDQVQNTLAVAPYDIYMVQQDGIMILVYNYRIKERNQPFNGNAEDFIHSENSQNGGDVWYSKDAKLLYLTFKNGKLISLLSQEGRAKSTKLLLDYNNIQKVGMDKLNAYELYWKEQERLEKLRKESQNVVNLPLTGSIILQNNMGALNTTPNMGRSNAAAVNPIKNSAAGFVKNPKKSQLKYMAARGNYGVASVSKLKKEYNYKKVEDVINVGTELEFGGKKNSISGSINYFSAYATGDSWEEVYALALNYRYFFTDYTARFRPYGRVGLGINIDHSLNTTPNPLYDPQNPFSDEDMFNREYPDLYSPIATSFRVGADFTVTKGLALNAELGTGNSNWFSLGLQIRAGGYKKS